MRIAFFILLLLPGAALSQHQLEVNVHGLKKHQGHVRVALYDQEESFLHFEQVYRAESTSAETEVPQVIFKDLPEGIYAIALFHDVNDNAQLDKNWLGIPKEKVAFSKAKMRAFGPPPFEDCSFEVKENTALDIQF